MAASKFTRNKDYTDDANNNAGGRDYIDPAGVDGEMDEILTVTDDHADRLDVLLRADLQMQDLILQGHEFSSLALSVLMGLLNQTGYINFREYWIFNTDYIEGDLIVYTGNNNTYICIVPHTSGVFVDDLAANKWHIFVPAGSSGIPPLVANRVLGNNGATLDWRFITTTEAPTLAPLANPLLTGQVGVEHLNLSGRMHSAVTVVGFSAAAQTLDFDGTFLKTISATGDYTAAITATNMGQGKMQEIHFTNVTGAAIALLWDAGWRWMGYMPTSLASAKKAVLTLRMPTGSLAANVVAMWSVEP